MIEQPLENKGTTYFVNERTGNDQNSGLDLEHPLRTRQAAIQKCRTKEGYFTVALDGSTVTLVEVGAEW